MSRLGVEDGVLELHEVAQFDAVFGHGRFVWLLQTDAALVLFGPCHGTAGLHDAELTAHAGHSVYTRSL